MNSILKKSLGFILVLFLMVFSLSTVVKVKATEVSVTYTITSKTTVSTTGTAPTNSSPSFNQPSGTLKQLVAGNSMVLTLSGYSGMTIKEITLSMKSNKTSGSGSLNITVGQTTILSIADGAFNDDSWNGAWSTEYVDVTKQMTNNTRVVQESEDVVITISSSANSLYCQSFTITYENPNANIVDLQSIALTNVSLHPGQTGRTTITYSPANATDKAVTYEITAGSQYAEVANDGTITAKATGVATLTVTPHDTNASARTCSITVTDYPAPAITVGKTYYIYANDSHGNYQLSGVTNNLGTGVTYATDFPNTEVFPLLAEQGIYVNTVSFKNGNDYLSLNSDGNNLHLSNEKNANSSWLVSIDEGIYFVNNIVYQTRRLQFNYNKEGSERFACYSGNQTAINFYDPTQTTVAISATGTTLYLDSTLSFNISTNAQNPVVTWNSSNTNAATIDSNGVLHPVGIGRTTVKATINEVESNEIEITVLPNHANPITIAQALALAEFYGNNESTYNYTTTGYLSYIQDSTNTINITDNTNTIMVYKSNHGFTALDNGIKVQVTGKLKTYNSDKEFTSSTITKIFTVTFDSNNGDETSMVEVLSGQTVNAPNPNPTRDGYDFTGWKCGLNTWNFASDVVTGNITITAQWQQQQANAYDDFKLLTPRASLKIDYTSHEESQLINSSFVKTTNNDTTLPDEWEGTVGGSYSSPYYQSFRNNNEYIVLKDAFDFPYSFKVSVTYYLNNVGNSGNQSSKLRFIALDSNDDEICSVLSEELNFSPSGSSNVRTVSVKLNGDDIKKIKIVFVKDGGGNIAFSTVTVNELSYTINKEENKNLVSMRFATLLSTTLVQRLAESGTTVTYGMVYGYSSSFGALTAQGLCDMISLGGSSEGDTSALVAQGIRFRAMSLTGVNSTGTEEVLNDPEYYQFGISINKFSDEKLDDEIKAFAYVCIDGNYYATNYRTFSVCSLAFQYVSAGDTSSYTEHLGVLKSLEGMLN